MWVGTPTTPELEEAQQQAQVKSDFFIALRDLGIDAHALERDPFSLAPTGDWLELFVGPIRWIGLSGDLEIGFQAGCYVPDPRITSGVSMVPIVPFKVKSLPVFGRVKSVRWKARKRGGLSMRDKVFNLRVAEHLSQDSAVSKIPNSADYLDWVLIDSERCCWIIVGKYGGIKWKRPLWDSYQAIAEALLAMPMAKDE